MATMITKSTRGFAAMSKEKRTAIAALGGKAAHAKGKAYNWTSETARKAGILGGKATAKIKANLKKHA